MKVTVGTVVPGLLGTLGLGVVAVTLIFTVPLSLLPCSS